MKKRDYRFIAVMIACLVVSVVGCGRATDNPPETPEYKTCLYMTDTNQGLVYTYDPAAHAASTTSLATVAPAAAEIYFYKGKGYVCVGYGSGEGVYRFDPSAANPSFARIGTATTAMYIAFLDAAKAFVATFGDGMYSFDPSATSPSFSAIAATSGMTLQDIVVGSDGMIYAADYGNDKVIRLNPNTGAIDATVSTRATGTTGLLAGSFNGVEGVFVANNGGYASSPAGSIDFVPIGAANGSTATLVANALSGGGSITPSRLVQLPDGDLVATGSGMTTGHTYRVDIVGTVATTTELKASGSPFGSLDIARKDGALYVPVGDYGSGTSRLYVMDEAGAQAAYSPVSVMDAGTTCISNIAFYED